MSDTASLSLLRPTPTVGDLLLELAAQLERAGIEGADAEARDIIAAVLNVPRFWPTLHRDETVAREQTDRARAAATSRASGMPFAYAVGRAAYRHLTLVVNEHVLIPRQETERLVDLVLDELRDTEGGVVADIGTGSGAIALSLATEGKFDRVIATDVSRDALLVAEQNIAALLQDLNCEVHLRSGSFLAPIREQALRAVVSNPPYVTFDEAQSLPPSVRNWEPSCALYSATGGTHAVRQLVRGSARVLAPGGLLAIEVDSRRASLAAELIMTHGQFTDVRVELDLSGRERFVLAKKES